MTNDLILDLLDRYFSGTCTRDELELVARWAADDRDRGEQLERMRQIWEASAHMPHGAATDPDRFAARMAWRNVHERIVEERDSARGRRVLQLYPPTERRAVSVRRWQLVAAAGVLAMTTGGVWAARSNWRGGTTSASASQAMREYSTVRGQRTAILLADGTRAVLSVESRLRVPATYGNRSRDVYLDGEGFFEVIHDSKMPFRVHTARALAEDLGTAFVVRAYPEDSTTTVVVTEGKVALRASDEGADRGAELTRGQLGQLDPSGVVNIVQHVDVERYLAWRQARLVFKRTPLAQVARELERWYDIDITLADSSLASVPVTGVFVSQPADRILRNVARSLDVKYTRQGREVRLRAH